MKSGIVLDSKKIIDKTFSASVKGYRALEVDEFLDLVANDYDEFANELEKLNKELDSIKTQNKEYFKQISELEAKNAMLSNKISSIKDDTAVSLSNLDLLNRIKKLEDALFKAGIDPTKL
ncbi:MAG: DivIVA domain-containing protein [Erysipelotrichales bacterium]|nr:DivIVA domain-containing protein [Erysipelotrichales bacterium]